MASGVLTLQLVTPADPNTMAAKLAASPDHKSKMGAIARMLDSGAAGIEGAHGTYRVDSSVVAGADAILGTVTLTNTITQSALVAGMDTLTIGPVTFTWVAATASEDQITIGASDTAAGDNLVTMIQAHSKLQGLFTASNAAGVVTISMVGGGRQGNLVTISEVGSAALTNTITDASLVATTDTLTIGNVTFTWVVATASEVQITIGGSDTLSGDNLVTMITGHSVLGSLFNATNASGVVTIDLIDAGAVGAIIGCTEVGSGQVLSAATFTQTTTAQVLSATSFASDTTETYEGDTTAFGTGV